MSRRTGLTIFGSQKQWLKETGRKKGVGQRFIIQRALAYYQQETWKDEAVVNASDRGYSGYVDGEKSTRKYVELQEDTLDWLEEKADKYGVTMSFLLRRSLQEYKENVIEGDYRDKQLQKVSE